MRTWLKEGLQSGGVAVLCMVITFPLPFVSIVLPVVQGYLTGYRLSNQRASVSIGVAAVSGAMLAVAAALLGAGALSVARILGVETERRHLIIVALLAVGVGLYNCAASAVAILLGMNSGRRQKDSSQARAGGAG